MRSSRPQRPRREGVREVRPRAGRGAEVGAPLHPLRGRGEEVLGAASARSMPVVMGMVSSPMRPMSWYSGSHDTPRSTPASRWRGAHDRVGVGRDAAVREDHATRVRGRAARVLEDRERFRVVGGPHVRVAGAALGCERVEQHGRRVSGDGLEELGQLRVDDHEGRVGGEDARTGLRDELLDRRRAASGAAASPSRRRRARSPGSR